MARQPLTFNSLDEVLGRISLLHEDGYQRRGNWSLGQNCNHLAAMMEFSQRYGATRIGAFAESIGFPTLVMKIGSMADRLGVRLPTLPFASPPQPVEGDDAVAVERLTKAIERQKCRLKAKSCTRFQLSHCGHHLGFLEPHSDRESHNDPESSEAGVGVRVPRFAAATQPE